MANSRPGGGDSAGKELWRKDLDMEKKLLHEKVWMWIVFAIFVLYSLTLIFPFVWCFYNSFKANDEFFLDVWSLPKEWLFSNWVDSLRFPSTG